MLQSGNVLQSLSSFELRNLSEKNRSRNDLLGLLLTRLNGAGGSFVRWWWTFGRHLDACDALVVGEGAAVMCDRYERSECVAERRGSFNLAG